MKLSNPYRRLPEHASWRKSVVGRDDVDPVVNVPFKLNKSDVISTAGSCFAQHIAKHLINSGLNFYIAEEPVDNGPLFTARYGNIYTTLQLLQLVKRAYGLHKPIDDWFLRLDGKYIDPFRPQIFEKGFECVDDLINEREHHLAAFRNVIENSSVFIFTLGLTERWVSEIDGSAFPVCPGAVATESQASSGVFQNATVTEMISELKQFIGICREVNPGIKFILTVSPVSLLMTASKEHVLVANSYSKSALRVVADVVSKDLTDVMYFPSYEIITGNHTRYEFYDRDLRSVLSQGVERVMNLFNTHVIESNINFVPAKLSAGKTNKSAKSFVVGEFDSVVCDEELLDKEN